ncbi:MAG: hypothetical protein RLZZ324_420 [Candidatus Parcubacteria bacterium]|jgi:uncharacterized membrane protein YphA (DoxX/SURF4 family)
MKSTRNAALSVLVTAACAAFPFAAAAHEAYVLPYDEFWEGIRSPMSASALSALASPANVQVMFAVVGGTLLVLALNFFLRLTRFGRALHAFPERFSFLGPLFVRGTVALALLAGALSGSFLGPELRIDLMPFAGAVRWSLVGASALIAAGLFTEVAAAVALAVFGLGCAVFGAYLLTYLNYFGELLALLLFGMRTWSFDRLIFGPLRRFKGWDKYATTIIRVCYGFALLYAGINVKLLHPGLTEEVVEQWHLTSFHALFPSDPLLVTFGGGLAEAAIGLFIIIGFEMRLTVLISLFYITLSLFYFRELVWPHMLLYGISLDLLVQPEVFTLDHFLFETHRKAFQWWKRPFQPHGDGMSREKSS